jgi:NAD(P)-dependent dehydrogenase (short-subunit alcohol dehydrogenase family)
VELAGRIVIITGASSGIGEATARMAADAGALVVLVARRADRLSRLVADLGGRHLAWPADLRDPDQVKHMVKAAAEHFGRLDVLVNNAGQGYHLPVEEVTLEDFRAVMELNVYGPLLAMQAAAPLMRRQGGGAIVNVSSGTVRMPSLAGVGAYAASKAALGALSAAARQELAGDGIAVSVVYPFVTATEFHASLRGGQLRVGPPSGGEGRAWNFQPDPPARVAEAIIGLIRSGEEEAVLVPGPNRS